MRRLSYRKFGKGSSDYEVFIMKDYCVLTGTEIYETLCFVRKENGVWIDNDKIFTGKSRKEVIEKVMKLKGF